MKITLLAMLLAISALAQAQSTQKGRNLIVVTDMEPDDRISLDLVAARLAERVLFV